MDHLVVYDHTVSSLLWVMASYKKSFLNTSHQGQSASQETDLLCTRYADIRDNGNIEFFCGQQNILVLRANVKHYGIFMLVFLTLLQFFS